MAATAVPFLRRNLLCFEPRREGTSGGQAITLPAHITQNTSSLGSPGALLVPRAQDIPPHPRNPFLNCHCFASSSLLPPEGIFHPVQRKYHPFTNLPNTWTRSRVSGPFWRCFTFQNLESGPTFPLCHIPHLSQRAREMADLKFKCMYSKNGQNIANQV